ncbi:VWA domain-containing protein [Puniceicoccales bacterium CK1056]|uniref:VWA domain-containing protein n=1 Tax=Oceanipulchritudo coccoides TaxID=2706888 RepID=A0A6B2M2H7_9BACT|nr:vWA domain-containing protein [Oceanipulchritudo coccoides]NDV63221.1 VWA domain-containing protein [Oceanipulchritudo coccoides]
MNLPLLPFSQWIVLLFALLGLWGLYRVIRAGAPVVIKQVHWTIIALRTLAFACLILAILDPFWRSQRPDPNAFRLAVLVDVSASMETRDLPDGQSRFEWVADWLNPDSPNPAYKALADPETPVEVNLFSSRTQPWDGASLADPLSGQTAIGDALESINKSGSTSSRRPLGGVLLISDGASLGGSSPAQVSLQYKRDGIPVSVIGVGQQVESGDLTVDFAQPELSFTEGQPAAVEITLSNSFSSDETGQLELFRGQALVDQRSVTVTAGESLTVGIDVDPGGAGVETFRAVYKPERERGNPATNVSYSIAEVEREGKFRFLLMSARAGWESRFLRLMAMESTTIEMDSLIRIDEGRFIKLSRNEDGSGSDERLASDRQTLDALPEAADFYFTYDAIIVDAAMLLEESKRLTPVLTEFSGTKGGGLLLYHNGPQIYSFQLPASLREIFPARDFSQRRLNSAIPLQLEVNPLFTDQIGGALFNGPEPEIPAGAEVAVPSTLSRAAQVHASSEMEGYPLLVTQAYGAGRTAWLAGDFLWRWQLGSDRSSEQYSAFWQATLSWLATGGKERLVSPVNAQIIPVKEETSLDIRLLGADFTPRMDATVTGVITGPDGTISEQRLLPDIEEPGRYTLSLPLQKAGQYQVDYEALFPDGDRLIRSSWFALSSNSPESRETAFQEKTLRDIARVAGGEYRSFKNWKELLPLPVSDLIPQVEQKVHWTRSLPFLLAAITLFLIEWWLRRRHGLR